MIRVDFVVCVASDDEVRDAGLQRAAIHFHEPRGGYRFVIVDSRDRKRSLPVAANLGAFHPQVDAGVIAFLLPQLQVSGPFLEAVLSNVSDDALVHTDGALFVARPWFTAAGGFDIGEDDHFSGLIRYAQDDEVSVCRPTLSLSLPTPDQEES